MQSGSSPFQVVFVSRKHPPSVGGMQIASYHLLRELRQRRPIDAVVLDCPPPLLPIFLVWAALRIARARAANNCGPTIVQLGDALLSVLAPWCRLFGCTPVVIAHGLDLTYPNPAYQVVVRLCMRCVERVICLSRAAREVCVERGVSADRCELIPYGTIPNAAPARRAEARAMLAGRLGRPLDSAFVLLTVGRLVRRKGVAWFIESVLPGLVAEHPETLYVVVGEGPDGAAVRQAITHTELADHVLLVGQVEPAKTAPYYAAADVFVMPNIHVPGDLEGLGIVALEAGAAGVPTVAADIEGVSDAVVSGVTGTLVPTRDTLAFHAAIAGLRDHPEDRAALGRSAALHIRERMTWPAIAAAYLECYERIVSRSS